jgi:hypothetical protein
METSDQINALTLTVLSRCRESLTTLILFLDGSPNANSSIAELGKQLHSCRDLLGGQAEIARRLGLGSDKNPVIRLDVLLRLLVKVQANATSTGMALDSVAIAGLRLLVHLEYLQSTQPRLSFNTSLPDLAKEQAHIRAYRQIRALELVLRGLIAEAHGNELEDKLISRYGREQIEKWRKASSSSDLLSGSLMRDLRNLLVDKKDYSDHYQSLFESQHHLRLLLTQRETLEQLLDEICNIRNTVAHNKDLSSAQTTLLDLCYSDIITPLQFACDEGRTQVNPDQFYDADQDSLQRWRDEVRDKLDMLGDDMVAISEGVKEINDTTKQIDSNVKNIQRQAQVIDENLRNVSADTSWLRAHWRKLALGMTVGLAAVVTISVANLGSSAKTLINTQDIKSGVQAIDSKMDTVKKEVSPDPRKELANRGVAWTADAFSAAVYSGDVETVRLFLEGGMAWRISQYDVYRFGNPEELVKISPALKLLSDHPELLDKSRAFSSCLQLSRHLIYEGVDFTKTPVLVKLLTTLCTPNRAEAIKKFSEELATTKELEGKAKNEWAEKRDTQACKQRLMKNQAHDLVLEFRAYGVNGAYDALDRELKTNIWSSGAITYKTISLEKLSPLVTQYCQNVANAEGATAPSSDKKILGIERLLAILR